MHKMRPSMRHAFVACKLPPHWVIPGSEPPRHQEAC
jgi:hypothetical protein